MQNEHIDHNGKLSGLLSTPKVLYFILFISYLVSGILLSKISFQSQIVPVWIPAGIALIGCYIWWWRFFPAVFIASFIFNCSVVPNFQLTDILSNIGLQNSIIATGAVLQAAVGAALLRYWLGNPLNEWNNKNTVYFVFIVGVFTNLISANIGVYALAAFNPAYGAESYWVNVVYWWFGDSLGVLLTAPFLLSLFNYQNLTTQQKKARIIIVYSVAVLFIIVTLMTWFFVSTTNIDSEKLVKKEVEVIENGVYRQLNNSIHQLQALAEYIQNNPDLSRDNFEQYVSDQIELSRSLRAMSWNPMIESDEKTRHETSLTKIYEQPMVIKGESLQANDPIVYVKLISPEQKNQKAIGFNVFSKLESKQTLSAALLNYQPKATPILQLVQSEHPEPAFLMFFPVFQSTQLDDNEQVKRLKGFATGVFLANNILSLAISEQQRKLFFFEFLELGGNSSFSSNTGTSKLTLQDNPAYASQNIRFAGQTWLINLLANEKFIVEQKNRSFLTLFLLQVSIVMTIMMLLLMMNNQHRTLDSLVRKRTQSLKKAMFEANKANKAKSQFLANMSHEIRTPMNSVIGFAQLATQSDDIDEIKSYLGRINVSSDLLLHIVNDILDISKIESQKLELNCEAFDVHQSLERITTVFENTAHNKKLNWKTLDTIPENLYFNGDQTRFEQVLMNLCSNAIKFTPKGVISLTAALVEQNNQVAKLSFIIKDTGVGIAPDNINKIFHAFTQEDVSTSRHFGGTGLGLTISKKLSKLMQGDIQVTSEVGNGSIFTFTCCLNIADEKPKSVHATAEKADKPQSIEHLSVLVAEDNRVNQKLIAAILQKLGIKADIVENGELAVAQVQVKKYDVILMDCQMPVLDGYEATKKIRAMPEYAELPIFALTADVDTRSKARAAAVGFTKHLSKPINIDLLIESFYEL
ncbi:MAG: ATP-binding protein [Thalassotalea sp.]